MRRYGRTLVTERTATNAAFDAHIIGSDHADYAGNCQSPVMVCLTGHPDERLRRIQQFAKADVDYARLDGQTYWRGSLGQTPTVRHVDIAVRCRKCEACMRARRNQWIARAKSEISHAPRTWFGTLTLRPEIQFRFVALARAKLFQGGTNYDDLSPDEQFAERCRPLVRELQLYFKRLRKAGCQFRYVVAIERHKSGAPHAHLLLHEIKLPVRYKALSDHWSAGFSKFNLVAEGEESRAAHYVAKYLTKSYGRMLASSRYGKTPDRKCHLKPLSNRNSRGGY